LSGGTVEHLYLGAATEIGAEGVVAEVLELGEGSEAAEAEGGCKEQLDGGQPIAASQAACGRLFQQVGGADVGRSSLGGNLFAPPDSQCRSGGESQGANESALDFAPLGTIANFAIVFV